MKPRYCNWPGCTEKATMEYRGYADYNLCSKHYYTIYSYFIRQVFGRDKWRCCRCGKLAEMTCDHILPRSQGGRHHLETCRSLCVSCHGKVTLNRISTELGISESERKQNGEKKTLH